MSSASHALLEICPSVTRGVSVSFPLEPEQANRIWQKRNFVISHPQSWKCHALLPCVSPLFSCDTWSWITLWGTPDSLCRDSCGKEMSSQALSPSWAPSTLPTNSYYLLSHGSEPSWKETLHPSKEVPSWWYIELRQTALLSPGQIADSRAK